VSLAKFLTFFTLARRRSGEDLSAPAGSIWPTVKLRRRKAQSSAPSSASSSSSASAASPVLIDHACKNEIYALCGPYHGDELKDCVKSALNTNKFTDSCKTEILSHRKS
jgi:hypothetical protein